MALAELMTIRKNIITGLVASLVLFNAVVPKIDWGANEADALLTALRCQSQLLTYASFSVIPLKIISAYLREEMGATTSRKHRSDNRKKGSRPDTSTGCFIEIMERLSNAIKRISSGQSFCYLQHGFFPDQYMPACPVSAAGTAARLFCVLIMLLILLPRGSIEEGALSLLTGIRAKSPFRKHSDRVFYFRRAYSLILIL